ncbi:hypothetical protein C4X16_21295 [Salmonella enterica]|nr:hypothetical protein [Salmonella enterica]
MKITSLNFGMALFLVGLILMGSAGAAESGSIIQEAINAILKSDSPFHNVASIGLCLSLIGSLLLAYWILFGGSTSSNDDPAK